MPKLFPSCSPGAPSWGAVRVEQRWDGRPEIRSFALIGSGRKRSGRCGARGRRVRTLRTREALASRPPALRPAARSSTERWAARGGDEGAAATAPDRGLEHGPRRCPEARPKGFSRRRNVERREAPRPDRKGRGDAFARCLGRLSPAAQERDRKRSAFPGAPLPWFGERDEEGDEGLPGADQRTRAMSRVWRGTPSQTPFIPAKAGIQLGGSALGPRFRGDERRIGLPLWTARPSLAFRPPRPDIGRGRLAVDEPLANRVRSGRKQP